MDDRSLQKLLDETATGLGVVGAQLAIFDGERLREFATGARNLELGLPVTADTVFQIGSTTKLFNAATIMTLVDEGRLDLNTPVKEYIPNFHLADAYARDNVTLRHLLSMSAGLDNGPYYDYGRGDDALGRYVGVMGGVPQIFKPGTAYGYSNASTNISGYAASCAMGKSWETLLAERILAPLSLNHAGTFAEDLLHHPVALGYRPGPDNGAPQRLAGWSLPRSMAPAGGTLTASAGDLVGFARMFLREGKSEDGKQVLSPAAVARMQEPQVTLPAKLTAQKWCIGPYWKQWGGVTIYGHSGTNMAGSSMLLWCPEKNFAIATLVNVANQGYPLADSIFNVVFPALFGVAKPKNPKAADITPAEVDLQVYTGRYESVGNTLYFDVKDGKLVATAASGPIGSGEMKSGLVPIGDNRFVPTDPAFGGNRGWDVAFWSEPQDGRMTHFLNGVFALRRTG